jgi:hypothetical protein
MVRVWGGRVVRWGLLTLGLVIVALWAGRLIYTLEGRVKVEVAGRQKAEAALAVDEAKLNTRDNLHVTVTAPPPQVTVTVAPGKTPAIVAPGATRVVTVPSPFAVPGPGVTTSPSQPPPKPVVVQECPVLHLLLVCL